VDLLEIWHATPLDFELQLGKPLLKLINTPSNLNIAVRCETIDVHTTLIYIEIRGVENNSREFAGDRACNSFRF